MANDAHVQAWVDRQVETIQNALKRVDSSTFQLVPDWGTTGSGTSRSAWSRLVSAPSDTMCNSTARRCRWRGHDVA